jgi:hypothetical protein
MRRRFPHGKAAEKAQDIVSQCTFRHKIGVCCVLPILQRRTENPPSANIGRFLKLLYKMTKNAGANGIEKRPMLSHWSFRFG